MRMHADTVDRPLKLIHTPTDTKKHDNIYDLQRPAITAHNPSKLLHQLKLKLERPCYTK